MVDGEKSVKSKGWEELKKSEGLSTVCVARGRTVVDLMIHWD